MKDEFGDYTLGKPEPFDPKNPAHLDKSKYELTPGDVWEHTIRAMEAITDGTDAIRWGVLLHDIGKPVVRDEKIPFSAKNHAHVGYEMTESILKDRFKFSNDFVEEVCEAVRYHMTVKDSQVMSKSKLKRYLQKPHFDTILSVSFFDSMGSKGEILWYNYVQEKREEWGHEKILPPPLLTGKHLIEMGFKPGPVFKEILTQVSTLQLDEEIHTVQEAVEFARKNWSPW